MARYILTNGILRSALHAHLAPGKRMEAEGARGARVDARSNDRPVRGNEASCGMSLAPSLRFHAEQRMRKRD